jgi:hypothetical protein
MPPGLPCRRSRRQSDTIPSDTRVPTPSAAMTGGVARKTARSTPMRRQQVEHAARFAMPAVPPAEQQNPSGTRVSNAIRRHDWRRGTQDCALHPDAPSPSGACRQACHAGGRAGRATQPERYAGFNAIRRHDWRRGPQDCALHPDAPSASGACRQACHAGGRAGRATQPERYGVPTPSAAMTGGVARKTARSTPTRRQQVGQTTGSAPRPTSSSARHPTPESGP